MDLRKIQADHAEWLSTGLGAPADLREADLREADLLWADLSKVYF